MEVILQAAPRREPLVDGGNLVSPEIFNPTCIIESLRHNFAWSAASFQFDKHERTIWSDGQQIDATAKPCILLPADQHPVFGEQTWRGYDHVFKHLLPHER